jgi:hypothetical protein
MLLLLLGLGDGDDCSVPWSCELEQGGQRAEGREQGVGKKKGKGVGVGKGKGGRERGTTQNAKPQKKADCGELGASNSP